MLDLVWSSKYLKYDFGPEHPFKVSRALPFFDLLNDKNVKYFIHSPFEISENELLLAHTKKYIEFVKAKAVQHSYLTLDTPIDEDILEGAKAYVGGTIKAFDLILNENKKFVFNLLGGLHHASSDKGEGFCVFNDIAVAINYWQSKKKLNKVLVLDIDVHAGNGTQDIFYRDNNVFTVSFHQDPLTLYPGRCFEDEIGEKILLQNIFSISSYSTNKNTTFNH